MKFKLNFKAQDHILDVHEIAGSIEMFYRENYQVQAVEVLEELGEPAYVNVTFKDTNGDINVLHAMLEEPFEIEKLDYNLVQNQIFSRDELEFFNLMGFNLSHNQMKQTEQSMTEIDRVEFKRAADENDGEAQWNDLVEKLETFYKTRHNSAGGTFKSSDLTDFDEVVSGSSPKYSGELFIIYSMNGHVLDTHIYVKRTRRGDLFIEKSSATKSPTEYIKFQSDELKFLDLLGLEIGINQHKVTGQRIDDWWEETL